MYLNSYYDMLCEERYFSHTYCRCCDLPNILVFELYLQLYMETIQDLLDPSNDNISIVEDPKTGDVSLPGANVVEIRDQQSFMELLRIGEANRFAANTKLNTTSSRSHAILMVNLLTIPIHEFFFFWIAKNLFGNCLNCFFLGTCKEVC